MKSSLLALLLLGQPAAAAELYLQTGVAYQFRHGACDGGHPCLWDRNGYAPGLAHIEIGLEQRFDRMAIAAFARHESLTAHHDFGVNQAGVQVRITLIGSHP